MNRLVHKKIKKEDVIYGQPLTLDRLGCPLSLDYYLSLPEEQLEGVGLSAGLEAILGSGQQQQGPRPRTTNNRSYGWCVMRRLEVPPQHKVTITHVVLWKQFHYCRPPSPVSSCKLLKVFNGMWKKLLSS